MLGYHNIIRFVCAKSNGTNPTTKPLRKASRSQGTASFFLVVLEGTLLGMTLLAGCWCPPGVYNDPNDDPEAYYLPYDYGVPIFVGQGLNGLGDICPSCSHLGTYAIDFVMDEGTPVVAARGGDVIRTRDICPDCACPGGTTSNPDCPGCCANYIYIQHADDSVARYVHLMPGGVCVTGGRVERGDIIGLSGHTGVSLTPHLHFAVFAPPGQDGLGDFGKSTNGSMQVVHADVCDDGIPLIGHMYTSQNEFDPDNNTNWCPTRGRGSAKVDEQIRASGWEIAAIANFVANSCWQDVLGFLADPELGETLRLRFRPPQQHELQADGLVLLDDSRRAYLKRVIGAFPNLTVVDEIERLGDTADTDTGMAAWATPVIEYRLGRDGQATGDDLLRILRRHGCGLASPNSSEREECEVEFDVLEALGDCATCPEFTDHDVTYQSEVMDIRQLPDGDPGTEDWQRCVPTAAADLVFWMAERDPDLVKDPFGGPPLDPDEPYALVDILAEKRYMSVSPSTGTDPVAFVAGLQLFLDDRAPDRDTVDVQLISDFATDARCALVLSLVELGRPCLLDLGLWAEDDGEPGVFHKQTWDTVVAVGYESTADPLHPILTIHDPGR